jgi:phthiocerol/phenolphthiocerol synthesis type-I polyketide synthase E
MSAAIDTTALLASRGMVTVEDTELTRDRSRDIAVVGLAARFPGAANQSEWWSSLLAGRILTTRYARDELVAAGIPPELVDDPQYVPVRGHLEGAEHFDNRLFRLSPREAELMDPQHRLMLQIAWSALEDAGMAPLAVPTRTGVFASATGSGYLRAVLARGPVDPAMLDDLVHGTEPDFMASRVAYKLGLSGPALAVQTACSSSLVAVHLAIRAILSGDCEQALVVASGFDFPQAGYLHLPGGVQSASGRCRPFDARADGVVGGSGVAGVVLRPLSRMTPDDPEPHGVILGSAVNNDGAAKVGYYAPSPGGQAAVIRAALRAADVDARSIGYLEAHGTGTRIGDPIEWSAASTALGGLGADPGQVAVGAVKANMGHLDAAAGIAGLIKALLVLKHGVIPPIAGFVSQNPLLERDGSPLFVPTSAMPWTGPEPRRAGVSAFGIGGTNAHVVVEAAPARAAAPPPATARGRLVVLSATDPAALTRNAHRLADHLTAGEPELADVCRTLATGRAELPVRLAVAGRGSAEVAERLRSGAGVVTGERPPSAGAPVVFLFPGQGAQRPGMAAPCDRALPGFGEALDRCLDAFPPPLGARLHGVLLDIDSPAESLNETAVAQPALFALGWATATALAGVGVRPRAVAGHSLGEITAACVAGAIDLVEAAAVVAARGEAMQACPVGAMLAIGCDVESARRLLAEHDLDLEVASVNGPDSCVLAGPVEAVEKLHSRIGDQLFTRRLRTTRAFHSRLIEPAIPVLERALATVVPRPLRVPIATNVDGRIIPAGREIPTAMLVEQARRPVRLAAVMSSLADAVPDAVALDLGPGRTLAAAAEAAGLRSLALTQPVGTSTDDPVLTTIGALWTVGQAIAPVDWCGDGRRIRLPGYAFTETPLIAPEAIPAPAPPRAPMEGAPGPSADRSEPGPPDPRAVLLRAWSDLLGLDSLTDDSDFFHLGGDSLVITRLARRVNTELGIQVPIRAMLARRTLGRQAELVVEAVRRRRSG